MLFHILPEITCVVLSQLAEIDRAPMRRVCSQWRGIIDDLCEGRPSALNDHCPIEELIMRGLPWSAVRRIQDSRVQTIRSRKSDRAGRSMRSLIKKQLLPGPPTVNIVTIILAAAQYEYPGVVVVACEDSRYVPWLYPAIVDKIASMPPCRSRGLILFHMRKYVRAQLFVSHIWLYAARCECSELVRWLITRWSPDVCDMELALEIAAENNNVEIAALLLSGRYIECDLFLRVAERSHAVAELAAWKLPPSSYRQLVKRADLFHDSRLYAIIRARAASLH
jgi:hypothetical protein